MSVVVVDVNSVNVPQVGSITPGSQWIVLHTAAGVFKIRPEDLVGEIGALVQYLTDLTVSSSVSTNALTYIDAIKTRVTTLEGVINAAADGDAIVNTYTEILAAMASFPEGVSILAEFQNRYTKTEADAKFFTAIKTGGAYYQQNKILLQNGVDIVKIPQLNRNYIFEDSGATSVAMNLAWATTNNLHTEDILIFENRRTTGDVTITADGSQVYFYIDGVDQVITLKPKQAAMLYRWSTTAYLGYSVFLNKETSSGSGTVPDATETVAGKSKLYQIVQSETDGGVSGEAVKDYVDETIVENSKVFAMVDDVNDYKKYTSYTPTFQGATQYWMAKKARVGRTVSSNLCNDGEAVLGIDLNNPSNNEGGDMLQYPTSNLQPNPATSTPAGLLGSNIVYYSSDGGFVRILNHLNSALTFKNNISPAKAAPYEYMTAVRINKGIVAYESICSGTFGIKYKGGSECEIYSNYLGNDHFQPITFDPTPYLDQIIILHFNATSATTMSFRISAPSVGNYYKGNNNWDVTFPTSKLLTNITIGTSSHPIIADHFCGVLKSNGSFTQLERDANIEELYKLYPIEKVNLRPYFAPTFSYASNIFTLNLGLSKNAYFKNITVNDLEIRLWKYVKGGVNGNPIDDRELIQHWDKGQFVLLKSGQVGNPLQFSRTVEGLPTDSTKPDIVADIRFPLGYPYPFVTAPFGIYF